jgi:hypothetical protein
MALRLANLTWKETQANREAWGEQGRTDPSKRMAFNPYEVLLVSMYEEVRTDLLTKLGSTPEARREAREKAFSRVVFEVAKDQLILKKAVAAWHAARNNPSPDP